MISIKVIYPPEWKQFLSKIAHEVCFEENWDQEKERIDYALLAVDGEDNLIGYTTIREIDATTAYMQYGGCFPKYKGTSTSFKAYDGFIKFLLNKYENITTLIENKNTAMLKFAMKVGFLVIGIRNFKQNILLEHLLVKETNICP